MSSAFVKEGDYQHLRDVAPNLSALLLYLRQENGGSAVRELGIRHSEKFDLDVHDMSDGLSYGLNAGNQWQIFLD